MKARQQDLADRLPEYTNDAIAHLSDDDLAVLLTIVASEATSRLFLVGDGDHRCTS